MHRHPKIIGTGSDPITFEALLDLSIILLKQGISSRALLDDGAC